MFAGAPERVTGGGGDRLAVGVWEGWCKPTLDLERGAGGRQARNDVALSTGVTSCVSAGPAVGASGHTRQKYALIPTWN